MEKVTKLLIVDDEAESVELIRRILCRHSQYQIKVAFSGKEALLLLESYSPEIILLDVIMSDMDGIELCRKIKSRRCHEFAKIIMISGMAMIEDRLKGYEAGADDYLAKPFIQSEFLAKLSVYSKLSRMEEVDSLKAIALNLICHETRTPLNGIVMGSELLGELEGLPAKASEYISMVNESALKLQELVSNISRYYSIKEGKKACQFNSLNVLCLQ